MRKVVSLIATMIGVLVLIGMPGRFPALTGLNTLVLSYLDGHMARI